MNRLIYTLLNLVWGLWFGGLIMLFLAVQWLFKAFADNHATAGVGASSIFQHFNQYRLGLAAAAVLLTAFAWLGNRRPIHLVLFILFALAVLAACYTSAVIAPQIETLRLQGLTHTDHFRHLHGKSMAIYMVEALFVLAAGLVLPTAYPPRTV